MCITIDAYATVPDSCFDRGIARILSLVFQLTEGDWRDFVHGEVLAALCKRQVATGALTTGQHQDFGIDGTYAYDSASAAVPRSEPYGRSRQVLQ